MKNYYIGIDIGSISLKACVIDDNENIVYLSPYIRHFGLILEETSNLLKNIEKKFGNNKIKSIVITGSLGNTLSEHFSLPYEIDTITLSLGALKIVPEVKTIINVGGQQAILIKIHNSNGKWFISDFSINEPCASGTGSFIEQQAERLSQSIFGENLDNFHQKHEEVLQKFIQLGLKSKSPAPVACRCTVFTKSDMIHLQNNGEPVENIIAGVHYGNAANLITNLIGNQKIEKPVIFCGGLAANELQVKAFKSFIPDIIVPEHFAFLSAIGAAILAKENNISKKVDFANLKTEKTFNYSFPTTEPLKLELSKFDDDNSLPEWNYNDKIKCFLGVDIGSTSTKYALIDETGKIIHKCYRPTMGRPIEVTQSLLNFLFSDTKGNVEIIGIATTGSGRNVIGDFLDADLVIDEITAHARGAVQIDKNIDTIFEIGGQDSKYIRLKNGYPIDFEMNKVCSAGTGSFLHELANKFKINIVNEFQDIALSSENPIKLSERCTVFMESDLMGYAQKGAQLKDLIAGLSYAIVLNYLNRVVGNRFIGNKIMFLGGPSLNKAIVAAFERTLKKEIIVPKHREVMGAYGAALLVKEKYEKEKFDLKTRNYNELIKKKVEYKETICRADKRCKNECKLKIYNFGGRKSIWGGDCGRYEITNYKGEPAEDYIKIRNEILLKYLKNYNTEPGKLSIDKKDAPIIGIPLGVHFHEWVIFYVSIFKELGFNIYLNPFTNNEIVKLGLISVTAPMCFPIKVFHGQVKYLLDKSDFYFIPNVLDMPSINNDEKSQFCPMVSASQYIVRAALDIDEKKIIRPHIHLKDSLKLNAHRFYESFPENLKKSKKKIEDAFYNAFNEYNKFKNELKIIGKEVVEKFKDKPVWIITGRPYNLYDQRLNLNISRHLAKRGIVALPFDFIEYEKESLDDFPRMYWGFGSRILRTAKKIVKIKNFFGMHITNFSCGVDSFLEHFLYYLYSNKPGLILEFDEHSAIAGILTRVEAFQNVVKNFYSKEG